MGQKFSEFKTSSKMEDTKKGTNVSNKTCVHKKQKPVNRRNSVATKTIITDNNGNTSTAPVSGSDCFESNNLEVCDNRIAEENGNIINVSNQESFDQPCLSSSRPSTCQDSGRVVSEASSKQVTAMKADTRHKKTQKSAPDASLSSQSKKKRNHWVLRLSCARLKSNNSNSSRSESDIPENQTDCDTCVCTGYHKVENHLPEADVVIEASAPVENNVSEGSTGEDTETVFEPIIDLTKFRAEDYPVEDCDERARQERAREMAEGVEPPPGYQSHIQLVCPDQLSSALNSFTAFLQSSLSVLARLENAPQAHTQVDYMHCLVPDLLQISSCSFYWGKMDRYEAERLLEGKPEGTFLLRDSAQEEYLFSVSFVKFSRSLHARIEQWNHRFSFDCHDPSVFASSTVCGLIEHYKDPTCCMFFEPLLTIPLHRNFTFPLQHLCRATICSRINYDGINQLQLPKTLKAYLKEYHYRQRLRVRQLDLAFDQVELTDLSDNRRGHFEPRLPSAAVNNATFDGATNFSEIMGLSGRSLSPITMN